MPSSPPSVLPFEQSLAELESILRELEDGAINLEEALARYERGVGLLRHCYSQLQEAEQKVKLLTGVAEDGGAELKPFEHVATFDAAKASVRKFTKSPPNPGIRE